jgi:hypothetical protein
VRYTVLAFALGCLVTAYVLAEPRGRRPAPSYGEYRDLVLGVCG